MTVNDAPPFDEPVFGAPWQAQAFAMVLQLHRRGLFTWREWADALASEIAATPPAHGRDPADLYWQQWLAALEQLVAAKGAGSMGELDRTRQGWERAAARTPHGQAIELQPGDLVG